MEEDTEFRDLIIKKLENNGVLLKMKVSKFWLLFVQPMVNSFILLGRTTCSDIQSS